MQRYFGFGAISAILVAAFSGGAMADGPASGCFERDYSAAHLAKYPNQVVDRMVLRIFEQGSAKVADMWVTTANQGHVAANGHGGQRFSQYLICGTNNGIEFCFVECDGGSFQVTKQNAKSLTFRTKYLMLNNIRDCGGIVDLAEVQGQPVSYRLNRVSDAVCAAEN